MKKIILLITLLTLFMVGCATWQFKTKNTVQVTDKAGNVYQCVIDYTKDQQGSECSFFVQKGAVIYKCRFAIEHAKDFIVEQDCKIEIVMEPNEPQADQPLVMPTTQTE